VAANTLLALSAQNGTGTANGRAKGASPAKRRLWDTKKLPCAQETGFFSSSITVCRWRSCFSLVKT
jgi:hypothetical protein